jgi:hypothetical protein
MRKSFGFYYTREDEVRLRIREYPWRWHFLAYAADVVCAMTRHRLCNSLVSWAYDKADGHVSYKEEFPASKEQWVEFAEATGGEDPSWWWTEEEES